MLCKLFKNFCFRKFQRFDLITFSTPSGTRTLSSCCWSTALVSTWRPACAGPARINTTVRNAARMFEKALTLSIHRQTNCSVPFTMPSTVIRWENETIDHRRWNELSCKANWGKIGRFWNSNLKVFCGVFQSSLAFSRANWKSRLILGSFRDLW